MVSHMKTTLNIADEVMSQLRREAAHRRCTISELVESALRRMLEAEPPSATLPPLPAFRSGGHLVNIDSREALFAAMADEECSS